MKKIKSLILTGILATSITATTLSGNVSAVMRIDDAQNYEISIDSAYDIPNVVRYICKKHGCSFKPSNHHIKHFLYSPLMGKRRNYTLPIDSLFYTLWTEYYTIKNLKGRKYNNCRLLEKYIRICNNKIDVIYKNLRVINNTNN